MTVLVNGATGFIGKALAESLLASGEQVRVLAGRPAEVAAAGLDQVEVFEGDITDAGAVDRAVAGSIPSMPSPAPSRAQPDRRSLSRGERGCGAAHHGTAKRHGVRRVVHCSTVGIHGNIVGPPASEATPIRPDGIYEITKAEGDQLALGYASNGVEVVAVRPAPVYGPGDTRLVKLYQLAGRKRVILLGDGSPRYHMVFIDDLVSAFRLAAETPDVSGEAFIIAGDDCRRWSRSSARSVASVATWTRRWWGFPPGRSCLPVTCASGSAARSASVHQSIAGGSNSSSTTAPTTPPRPHPARLRARRRPQRRPRPHARLDQGQGCWRPERPVMDPASTLPHLRAEAGGVVRLILNRPHAYNSLSYELLGLLQAELERISANQAARVLVIAGAGRAFCAGHDLKEIGADLRDAPVRALFERCAAVMTALTRLPQPVIARVMASPPRPAASWSPPATWPSPPPTAASPPPASSTACSAPPPWLPFRATLRASRPWRCC